MIWQLSFPVILNSPSVLVDYIIYWINRSKESPLIEEPLTVLISLHVVLQTVELPKCKENQKKIS